MEKIIITTEQQLQQALQLRRKVFIEEQGVDEQLEYDDYDQLSSECTHVMIVDHQQVIAVGRYRIIDNHIAKLQRICVHPNYRNQGYGRHVIEFLEYLAKQSNLTATKLDAQVSAVGFYVSLGYHQISTDIFLDAGIEHVSMMKFLSTIELKNRLLQVAQLIKGNSLADIGSDHAYLPIYAIQNRIVNHAIAGEVVEGPYQAACQNVQNFHLTNKISVRKGNGLFVLKDSDKVETITICGMGGSLITSILDQGQLFLEHFPQLILQPNLHAVAVREWLLNHQYQITNELILEEDGHIYEIIVAEKGKMSLNEVELLLGPHLIKYHQNHPAFQKKWQREVAEWQRILHQLDDKKIKHQIKIKELNDKISRVSQYIH